ncbi:hypothetical protein VW35_14975 [Devosia soli]|uniref:AAA+ ATPase domain-containing protein n=1 Tax=Devosia soli TaxID=361041 RepID=A0A0F5L4W3_9HYPH|nr:AAA family ATPase [Devosia soli]KKB77451.1 hypothetical protein VW35_14975 [Devosia soli]
MSETENAAASAADLLARAYIDALAAAENVKIKSMVRGPDSKDSLSTILDELEDDPHEDDPHLRVDLVMAAVLTAKAVASEPGLARRLRKEAPIVTIETHTADMVPLVRAIVDECAAATNKGRHIVARDGSEKSHAPDRNNAEVIAALNRRKLTVGIAPDVRRYLPSTLMRMTEYRLVLPAIDDWAIKLVIEAVTGEACSHPIDPRLVRNADMSDLSLAIRSGLSPAECVARLVKIVHEKSQYGGEGPALGDLHGYGEAMEWALDLVEDLREYRAGRLDWELVDNRALLLAGAPGLGKTTFAAALAKSAGVPLISTSVAEWNASSYLSGTLQMIRDAFGRARRNAPSVLLIDELDGISDRASLTGDYVEYWSQIVNYLLEHLSSGAENVGVVVIGTTNFASKIDPAILRSGRLDRQIILTAPGAEDLAKIFGHYLTDTIVKGDDLMPLALAAEGKTGADVEAYVKRAKAAARRARRELRISDVLDQIQKGGPKMRQSVRRRVATHEAGHVIVGRALNVGEFLVASIGEGGGQASFEDAIDTASTPGEIENVICLFMAGRAAERLTFGDCAIGSGLEERSDLARATSLAEMLETKGAAGNLYLPDDPARNMLHLPGLISAVKTRLDKGEARAAEILEANRALLDGIAARLDADGYLSATEIDKIEIVARVREAAE